MADTPPKDLQTTPQPDTDKNYFNFKATGLKIDKSYAIKFQWVYEDGELSDWSPGYFVNTATEQVPGAVTATVPSTAIGNIPVTLSAFPLNTKRVDIYIIGGVYGTGKVADSFFGAGTKNISVAAGVYQVSLIAVTPSGINGDPTNTFTITITNIVTEDTVAPDPILSGVVSGGVHPQDSSGQLGYLNVGVTNSTIPADFAGYIVKIVGGTNTWNQTFNSTTALSNLYITGGLFVGQSYTLSVATTDGKNISNYVNCSPAPYTIIDTRSNSSTVTGSLSFSATDSILTVSWTASTDPYVDSYRVQITSNTDTNFLSPLQTVESKGTTATFGGLDSNTTYRIRVTTRYSGAAGTLSTSHTTGTFTLDSSGAISDEVAPTTNPELTSSMVKSLFGAFAITFPPIVNPDSVVYEVFIKPDNATGIVSNTYKVLEVGGTFAVVRTLADRVTTLSYGTNYYIAVRAKDNDGVSTGLVTPVGPIQTMQVSTEDLANLGITEVKIDNSAITAAKIAANAVTETKIANDSISSPKIIAGAIETDKIAAGAIVADKISANAIEADKIAANAITATKIAAGAVEAVAISANAITAGKIAADAVLANNIKAGEIDATKLTADTILAEQKITVGSNSALDRIRLDATNATISGQAVSSRIYIGGGNYYDTASPFYADNLGRLSIGQKLKFENGELTINGKGTFTGTVTAGSGSNSVSVGNDVNGTNDGIYIGATGDYIYTDGTLRLGNGGITYSGGLLNIAGNITANAIAVGTNISGATGTFTGSITGSSGTFGNITLNSSGITSTNFSVTSTGILSAASGTIGGWDINGTQLRSLGTNYITLNPLTPRITLVKGAADAYGSTGSITIDPIEGIKDGAGNFSLTPAGILTVKGAITSGSTISGADITMTGAAGQTGVATTKLFFQSSNYAISAGASSYTYQGDSGYYDSEGDWVDTSAPQTISNNDIRFTDATYGGAVPTGTNYYYGELWLGSGNNSAGSVDLWANYPPTGTETGFIGISLVANSSSKNIYVYGASTAGFGIDYLHRSSTTDSSKEAPAFLQVDSSGRMSRGRAVITGGSSSPSNTLGLLGDLYFSTAT